MFIRTITVFLVTFALTGCAATTADVVKTQGEELAELRVALAGLREQDSAKPFRPDLERAATLLGQAEAQLGSGDPDEDAVAMLIALSRGQMVLVKSMVARALAEAALKQVSADYEATQASLKELEAKQEQLDPDLGDPR